MFIARVCTYTDISRSTGHRYAGTHETPDDFQGTEPCFSTELFSFHIYICIYRHIRISEGLFKINRTTFV